MAPVHLEFTYTPDDLAELKRAAYQVSNPDKPTPKKLPPSVARKILRCVLILGLFWMLVALLHIPGVGGNPFWLGFSLRSLIFLGAISILFLVTGVLMLIAHRIQRKVRDRVCGAPMTMEIADEGVTLSTGPVTTNWKWPVFDKYIEREDGFFLRVGENKNWVMVPKHAFADRHIEREVNIEFSKRFSDHTGSFPINMRETTDRDKKV